MNLKAFYDAAQAASAEVLQVANEIETAFSLGTDAGTEQALSLKATLDEAEAKASAANELYISMRKAGSTGDAAAKFVPVSGAEQAQTAKKVITRAQYEAMDHPSRYQFLMKDGGMVVDSLQE